MQIIRENALFLAIEIVRHERPFCKSVINLHFLLFFTFLVIWKNLLSSVSTQTWPSQQCSLAEHVFPLQGSWASASNSSSNNSAKLFIWKAKSSKFIRNEYLVPNRRLSEKLEVWTRNFLPHWFYVKSICHIWGRPKWWLNFDVGLFLHRNSCSNFLKSKFKTSKIVKMSWPFLQQ